MSLTSELESLWRSVAEDAVDWSERSWGVKEAVDRLLDPAEREGLAELWYQVFRPQFSVRWLDSLPVEVRKQAEEKLQSLAPVSESSERIGHPDPRSGGWVKLVATHLPSLPYRVKQGYSPTLRSLAEWLQIVPGGLNEQTPFLRNPVGSMLSGGLLGAGIGLPATWLLSQFLPKNWNRSVLLPMGTALMAVAGAAPGMVWKFMDLKSPSASGRSLSQTAATSARRFLVGSQPQGWWAGYRPLPTPPAQPAPETVSRPVSAVHDLANKSGSWKAAMRQGLSFDTGLAAPTIDTREIVRSMWEDPLVANRLPLPLRAAGTGLLEGASRLASSTSTRSDAGVRWISPVDMARMTAGMGTGYLSGLVVGKGLQLLTGMPESAAERIRETGVWAGALANLIPLAFGAQP